MAKKPKILGRDDILGADDLKTERVNMPEWKGAVYVRTMTAAERDSFEAEMSDAKGVVDPRNIRARLAVRVLVNGDGNRLFEDGDAEALGAKSGGAVDRVFDVAQRLNRLGRRDIEDLAKN